MDDFSKYEKLRDNGCSASLIAIAGAKDGLDEIAQIRMLRKVLNLPLVEAKQLRNENWTLDDLTDDHIAAIEEHLSSLGS